MGAQGVWHPRSTRFHEKGAPPAVAFRRPWASFGDMKEFTVPLPTSGGPMDLHCFLPDGAAGRLPAIIVLQEAFGVNAHMKRVCRRVASAGYAAFSPELFHRSGKGLEFGYDEFPKIRPIFAGLTNAMVLEDLKAAFEHVAQRPDVDPA